MINESKPAPTRLDFSCAYASNAGNGHVGRIALVQCGTVWNPETERYRFFIYEPEHVCPKYPAELAIPIIEDGVFIDLLFINDPARELRAVPRSLHRKRINISTVLAGQKLGIKEVDDGIWLASFMDYDL